MRHQEFNDIDDMVNVIRSLATLSVPFTLRSDFRTLDESGVAIEELWILDAEMSGIVGLPDDDHDH